MWTNIIKTLNYRFLGKEFELVIDRHGADNVSGLMQKVICALEHLEKFSADADREDDTIEQLRNTVKHLEREEAKKIEEKHKVARVRFKFNYLKRYHMTRSIHVV